jgi:endonuclease-8
MPEGHVIRRMADDHLAWFGGRPVRVASPQGRFAAGAAAVDGAVLIGTDAHGKHLFHDYGAGRLVHVHLGIYGKFTIGRGEVPAAHGELRMRMVTIDDDEPIWMDLRGPSACEVIDPLAKDAIHARLGADPLRRDDASAAREIVARSRAPVGLLLMDQTVVAGVGNVYRAEVLFRQRRSPFTPGRDLEPGAWDRIWSDLGRLLRAGVRAGRIVTTEPADRDRRGGRVGREDAHYVYRRQGLPCRVCGTEVRTQVFGGRNLFWCPQCQGN